MEYKTVSEIMSDVAKLLGQIDSAHSGLIGVFGTDDLKDSGIEYFERFLDGDDLNEKERTYFRYGRDCLKELGN